MYFINLNVDVYALYIMTALINLASVLNLIDSLTVEMDMGQLSLLF